MVREEEGKEEEEEEEEEEIEEEKEEGMRCGGYKQRSWEEGMERNDKSSIPLSNFGEFDGKRV